MYSNFFEYFENIGLMDAWRFINKNKKEFSWYSHKQNGFRLDHFFVDKKLESSITACYYDHKLREENISDHSSITLTIKQK